MFEDLAGLGSDSPLGTGGGGEGSAAPLDALFKQRNDGDRVVALANEAYERIESHRKLFRRDWLPFLDGVYHLSIKAWEIAGSRKNPDGTPDWTYHRVQLEFRKTIQGLPWANYFDTRRDLLTTLRQIGGNRERFLQWYDDNLSEAQREKVGYPRTLWRMFERDLLKPKSKNTEVGAELKDEAGEQARDDADRMSDLVDRDQRWQDFGERLRQSLTSGSSNLEPGLREELDSLLEGVS